MRNDLARLAGFALIFGPAPAKAQEIHSLLYRNVVGYDIFGQISAGRAGPEIKGFAIGGGGLAPRLDFSLGYDSAPDGAGGSALLGAAPSLAFADPVAGFAAYAGWHGTRYPEDGLQDTSGATVAAAKRWELPAQRVTLSAGYLTGDATGFALDTVAITQPLRFAVADARAGDAITDGAFTITPDLQADSVGFPGVPTADREDARARLTLRYAPGGGLQVATRLQATAARYRDAGRDAGTTQALAGLTDTADGLWQVSLLAGVARRQASSARRLTAPVLEAALDWWPAPQDRLSLSLAHEIDDPDEISAAPATLTEARLNLRDATGRAITLQGSARIAEAAYLGSNRRETLASAGAQITWRASGELAFTAGYSFQDRQANYLRAANEQVVTLEAGWTP
ncbi:MAG: hypothetical protein B7Z80_14925 [Rhodospirillales bacterium 20-64-7]|nr:MAG: hypothetical protein B7Z80_14925 [Rhodospirillales bacterium 20-64-7]